MRRRRRLFSSTFPKSRVGKHLQEVIAEKMARKPRAHLHQRVAALASLFTETSRLCSRASVNRVRLNEGQVLGSLQALTDDRNVVGSGMAAFGNEAPKPDVQD